MTRRDTSDIQPGPGSAGVDRRDAAPGAVLIDRSRIARRVHELGDEIARDLAEDLNGQDPASIVFMPVLVGSFIFAADLVRAMPVMMSMQLVTVSSYPGAAIQSKGARLKGQVPQDLAGKHVIVVDDILDTGQTLSLLRDLILEQRPASLRICVLLHKVHEADNALGVRADYVGFTVPDVFVVGYGLDHDGRHRNLPDIVELVEPTP
jgi:hypoxanthine phosphoribosyltransferase